MISIKRAKIRLVEAIFGCFFGILGLILPFFANTNVSAIDPPATENVVQTQTTEEKPDSTADNTAETEPAKTRTCDASLGSLGWLVCPTTGKISEAVDWLYAKNKEVLEINPVRADDDSPIYQIWRYFLGVANIAFVVFLLIVVYSQITGVGISNYGIKKALPKLIIVAIMVNLSFLVCSLAVDVSNILGNGLRGVFQAIEESSVPLELSEQGFTSADSYLAMTDIGSALLVGGGIATLAGIVAFEGGEIWLLIPVVLGALVAVVVGLITIALRQAVVILLIMIAPLAIVAYILPNTEKYFRDWKNLLIKMLVFYPMYSLLFGASSLAGWAIISSSTDGFGIILGTAVKIFPLIFSWSLMKMSGTFLGTVNAKITGFFAKPLATNRAWAESHKELTKQKFLASGNVYTPSLRLRQFLSDRKIAREEETKEHAETAKLRGLAYAADRNYDKTGKYLSREGEESHAAMTRRMDYQRRIQRHKNNFNDSVEGFARNEAQRRRLKALDDAIIRENDRLKMETSRGELIDYRNAVGFHERMEDAINAHFDETEGYTIDSAGNRVRKENYKFHFDGAKAADLASATSRYNDLMKTMNNNAYDAQYAAAAAAHARDTQQKIHDTRLQKYAELLPPTRDVQYRLNELIDAADKFGNSEAVKNMDAIISFMRVLNQRGDTDLVSNGIYKVLSHGVELGTHATQALAGFTMFEVKDSDPFLRRFGKYINLETAQVFNKNKRKNRIVTLDEYVTGQYEEDDPNNPGQKIIRYSKRALPVLIEGTSFDGIERTGYSDGEAIMMHPYIDENGKLDVQKYFKKRAQIDLAMQPQFISASLKYISGSEQLKSAVKYKTGYSTEMMVDEDTGNVLVDDDGEPLYESVAVWDAKDNPFGDEVEYAKEYYRDHTMGYLWDQTPSQILGLRSDYYDGLRENLADTFLMNKDEELTEDEKQIKSEYLAEVARINQKYGPKPKGKQKVSYNNEMKRARHKIAGAEMIKWLDKRGTLEQIYRSSRSGVAMSAKPWVREWLGLDNEVMMRAYSAKKREEQRRLKKEIDEKVKKENMQKDVDDNNTVPNPSSTSAYTEAEKDEYINGVEDLYHEDDNKHNPDDYYDSVMEYLGGHLAPDSYVMVSLKKMRQEDPEADSNTIKSWALDLLDDLDNY